MTGHIHNVNLEQFIKNQIIVARAKFLKPHNTKIQCCYHKPSHQHCYMYMHQISVAIVTKVYTILQYMYLGCATNPSWSTQSHSTCGEGINGDPSYNTTVAPTARDDTSQFHIIQPVYKINHQLIFYTTKLLKQKIFTIS